MDNQYIETINSPKEETRQKEVFSLLSEIHKSPVFTQRELSQRLNISLGKTNYLLQQLIKKGFIKIKSFSSKPGKIKKIKYILTPKGLENKIRLTYHFLKKKEAEYNYIKDEWERFNADSLNQGS